MSYVYFDIYGESARGIEPTNDIDEAIKNGTIYGLEVFDTCNGKVVYDPRKERWIL